MIDRILIADDEFLIRQLLEETARRRGIDTSAAASGEEAIELLGNEEFQMAFVDLKMGKASGMDVLRFAVEKCPKTLFVIMTAYGTVETAIEAIKMGAFDFVIKPFSPDQMDVLVEKARLWLQMDENNKYLRQELVDGAAPPAQTSQGTPKSPIIGSDVKMQELMRLIQKVAPTDSTVLITGESGTGKELVASQITKFFDPSGSKPYIRMNCAAIPETLLESELFGHEKGAFTGATERRVGRFELADGGTLLLDEIGEISPGMQAKLLRVLQESEFERVGGGKTIKVKVRVIATTNRRLREEVAAGRFREDLFYRLNVFPIELPPLRERGRDAAAIAAHFLARQARKLGRKLELSPASLQAVCSYPWPGNIRELENVVERVAILADGPVVEPADFPADVIGGSVSARIQDAAASLEDDLNLARLEMRAIQMALERTSGNRTKAASLLGFSVRTLRNKLNEYKADPALREFKWLDAPQGQA